MTGSEVLGGQEDVPGEASWSSADLQGQPGLLWSIHQPPCPAQEPGLMMYRWSHVLPSLQL